MPRLLFLAAALVSLVFLPSCSTVRQETLNQPGVIRNARSAYLVIHEDSSREMNGYMETALAKKGLRVTSGPFASKPAQADIYVEYTDRWAWDLAMYLRAMQVSVRDNRTRELAGSASFQQGLFHSFPNAPAKCQEVVDAIFENR